GIQSLAGWLWNRVANWVSSIWNGILGFFGIHSPSKQMAWVGDMLVAGLAGAITTRGHKAADAAKDMAKDTMDAMEGLTNGVNVPIKVREDLSLPNTDLTPASVKQTSQTEKETKTHGVDVQGVADATAARILKGLDIKVVLSDGTLVGKLAPKIDQQLSRLSRRANLLAAGV
ncbi:MAG: phage tail protein, partial [Varibaculum cambriense]|nr:phage tail protein [Varibaculum cambriense]